MEKLTDIKLVEQFKKTVEPSPKESMEDAWMFVFDNRKHLYDILDRGLMTRPIYSIGDKVYLVHGGSSVSNSITIDRITINKIDTSTSPISYWANHQRWYPEFLFTKLDDAMIEAKRKVTK